METNFEEIGNRIEEDDSLFKEMKGLNQSAERRRRTSDRQRPRSLYLPWSRFPAQRSSCPSKISCKSSHKEVAVLLTEEQDYYDEDFDY